MTEEPIHSVLDITVNIDGLTLGDLESIDRANRKELGVTEMLDLLDRVVVGGARRLPLSAMQTIMDRIQEAMEKATNPQ